MLTDDIQAHETVYSARLEELERSLTRSEAEKQSYRTAMLNAEERLTSQQQRIQQLQEQLQKQQGKGTSTSR